MPIKEFNKSLGLFIKTMREKNNLTQAELAASMNVNPQNISSYERGERCPSLFWLHRLSIVLKIDLSEFVVGFEQHASKPNNK